MRRLNFALFGVFNGTEVNPAFLQDVGRPAGAPKRAGLHLRGALLVALAAGQRVVPRDTGRGSKADRHPGRPDPACAASYGHCPMVTRSCRPAVGCCCP